MQAALYPVERSETERKAYKKKSITSSSPSSYQGKIALLSTEPC